jgi:mono/diheme cytochrome c family protein
LGVTEEVLNFTMERSVAARADDIKAPDLSSDDLLSEGIPHFDEMCADCHGAPGKEPNYIGKGLNPPAPDLASEAEEWSDAELFWITKHGVKMTGMPAFGQTHDDEELWPIVAAIRELPELSPDEYADRVDGHHDGGEADGHEGEH